MPFASQLPASGTLPYKPIRSQATPICCKHVLMLTTCQSQATLLVGKPVSQRNNDSGRLNKTCQNLSSMSIIQNHHLWVQTCMCIWAAPEHALECSCACPLHHELPHQLFKLYLIIQVAVSIHPARAELSEAAYRRSCDCCSSDTTVAMVTSGHADKHCIFATANTSLFKIIQLYYTTHTTAISVIQRDAKASQQRQQQQKSAYIIWLPLMWAHFEAQV